MNGVSYLPEADPKRTHFVQDVFGVWRSYEDYVKFCVKRRSPVIDIRYMSYAEMTNSLLLLSAREIDALKQTLFYRAHEDGSDDDYDLYEEVWEAVAELGDPRREANLIRSEPDRETARFCRIRHQRVYACDWCDYRMRRIIAWTNEGGLIYPPDTEFCSECPAPPAMMVVKEYYAPIMPSPYGYDPEPLRTAAVGEILHL